MQAYTACRGWRPQKSIEARRSGVDGWEGEGETQLVAKGVPADYIEYMMGHRISTYHDIRMKGVEFLRNVYAQADLHITPREKADIYDFIEDILRSRGYLVDRELLRRAIVQPHRTVVMGEEERRQLIREAFLEMLRRELLDASYRKARSVVTSGSINDLNRVGC